jgi:hypothetical protein
VICINYQTIMADSKQEETIEPLEYDYEGEINKLVTMSGEEKEEREKHLQRIKKALDDFFGPFKDVRLDVKEGRKLFIEMSNKNDFSPDKKSADELEKLICFCKFHKFFKKKEGPLSNETEMVWNNIIKQFRLALMDREIPIEGIPGGGVHASLGNINPVHFVVDDERKKLDDLSGEDKDKREKFLDAAHQYLVHYWGPSYKSRKEAKQGHILFKKLAAEESFDAMQKSVLELENLIAFLEWQLYILAEDGVLTPGDEKNMKRQIGQLYNARGLKTTPQYRVDHFLAKCENVKHF